MPTTVALILVAALMGVSMAAVPLMRFAGASRLVYGACLALSVMLLGGAVRHLLAGAEASTATLPAGLPGLGASFRIDALSAFFLTVVDFGAAVTSLYAIGYGEHEAMRARVLPFFPAFLAAMNLVLIAADAFSFLLSWEFMSVASWALVVAHHRVSANARAGYVYLLMASF